MIPTTDIQTSVRQRSTQADFRVERIGGGLVTGKTLPTTPDYSTVNVFIDVSTYIVDASGNNIADASYTLAHEYGHIYDARLRHAAATTSIRNVLGGKMGPTVGARLLVTNDLSATTYRVDHGIPAGSFVDRRSRKLLMLPPLPAWPGGPHPAEIAAMQAMRAHLVAMQAGATVQQARTRHLLLLRR